MGRFQDQAAGLRRMMAVKHPRMVSILTTSMPDQSAQLHTNIASSLAANNNEVVLLHPGNKIAETRYHLNEMPALLDVASYQTDLVNALLQAPEGFVVGKFTHQNTRQLTFNDYTQSQLDGVVSDLTNLYDIVLVDAALNKANQLPLDRLLTQEILIELSNDQNAIMRAYGLMKRICKQVGQRSFSIVVSNATDAEAQQVFQHIASVAWQYLKISLSFFGAIPSDVYLKQAQMIGRSVIDAFPAAMATSAFAQIAQKLDNGLSLQWQSEAFSNASIS